MAQDVLDGQFASMPNADGKPTVWYLAPDTLRWEDCERGYGDWLAGMIGGGTTAFYLANVKQEQNITGPRRLL